MNTARFGTHEDAWEERQRMIRNGYSVGRIDIVWGDGGELLWGFTWVYSHAPVVLVQEV